MIDYTSAHGLGSHCMESPEGRARMFANQNIASEVGFIDPNIRVTMNTPLHELGNMSIESFVGESKDNYKIALGLIKGGTINPQKVLDSPEAGKLAIKEFSNDILDTLSI